MSRTIDDLYDQASGGDTRIQPGQTYAQGDPQEYANFSGEAASDAKIASDEGISESQLSPGLISAYQQQEADRAGGFWEHTIMDKVVPAVVIGGLTAGAGAAIGGAAGGALGVGSGVSSVIGGAAGGALSGAGVAYGTGQPIGQAALRGGVTGAISGGAGAASAGLTNSLVGAGLNSTVAGGLVKTGIGAATGAVGAGLTGGNIGSGAIGGAERAGIGAGAGAIGGYLGNQVGPLFSPGSDPTKTDTGGITAPDATPPYLQPNGPSNSMSTTDPFGDPQYPPDPSTDGNGPLLPTQNPNPYPGMDLPPVDPTINPGPIDPGAPPTANIPTDGSGGAAGNSALTALLGKLFGGGGGAGGAGGSNPLAQLLGGGGASSGLLAQLLGIGSTAAGGALNSDAAKAAAGTYANQTHFNPYGVSTNNGSTSFDGTNATSTLSPGAQSTADALTGLNNSSAAALAAGPGAAQTADFNSLASSQLQAQQRLMSNTQDNEFANGVLGSTAGQYQTQGAMGAVGQQIAGDQVTAANMANTQQQQQLAQLTAGLNGSNQINASQLAQIQQGSNTGQSAGSVNLNAYQPSLAANSNSNIGNLLTGLGNGVSSNSGQSNNNSLAQFLASLGIGSSDRRVKRDIVPITDMPNGLTVYAFKYYGDDTPRIGYMAQEVEKLYPAAVHKVDGILTVDYRKVA